MLYTGNELQGAIITDISILSLSAVLWITLVVVVLGFEIAFRPLNRLRRAILDRKRPSVGDVVYSYADAASVIHEQLMLHGSPLVLSRDEIRRVLELRDIFRHQSAYSPMVGGGAGIGSVQRLLIFLQENGVSITDAELCSLEDFELLYLESLGLV